MITSHQGRRSFLFQDGLSQLLKRRSRRKAHDADEAFSAPASSDEPAPGL
jgi:hypothetical protein